MRIRFTIDSASWKRACEYAEATNRTFTELVCEALDQLQARYPKRPRCDATCEERVMARVLAQLTPQVHAGTSGADLEDDSDCENGLDGQEPA